jgi:hypothetical protein
MVVIEQGGTTERAFNTVDRIINNITTTVVFFVINRKPCREIAKE